MLIDCTILICFFYVLLFIMGDFDIENCIKSSQCAPIKQFLYLFL